MWSSDDRYKKGNNINYSNNNNNNNVCVYVRALSLALPLTCGSTRVSFSLKEEKRFADKRECHANVELPTACLLYTSRCV